MRLPIDKQAHFWAGAAIAALVTLYSGSPSFGLIACYVAAAAKELRDSMGYGTPDVFDFIATALGGIVVLPYYWMT